MRRALALLVLAAAAGGCGGGAAEPASGAFSLLTYNVAGLPEGISKSRPRRNTPLISPLLEAHDLVLVQEDFAYHAALVSRAGHPFRSRPGRPAPGRFVADGLNRLSRLPFRGFTRVPWARCFGTATRGSADCLATKGFSVALTTLGEGAEALVYNLHMDAGGGKEDIAARESQVGQLIADIRRRGEGRAVIVAGDTNLHRERDPVDRLQLERLERETGIRDVCLDVACAEDSIDRVFLRSGGGVTLTAERWGYDLRFVDASGEDLSDHKAVAVRVRWARQRGRAGAPDRRGAPGRAAAGLGGAGFRGR